MRVNKIPSTDSENVYVVCEGMLGNGNASLYLYHPSKDSIFGDIYSGVNGNPLGDIFESMLRIDNRLFLCINNSDKIIVLDAGTWTQVGTINISKPRNILYISPTKAYVSTLFSNKLYIINPQTLQVTGDIAMPDNNPEGMLLYMNTAYICTWDTLSNTLYGVDINTDAINTTIKLAGYAPHDVLLDKEQKLWVLAGSSPTGQVATFTCIDPFTNQVLQRDTFPADANAIKPILNNAKDSIYFIEASYSGATQHNGIYRMSIHSKSLPENSFIPALQYQYFWGLGIDPVTGNVYAGDPKGFTQKGVVAVYRTDGTKISEFKTGVGPGAFLFDRK